MATQNKDSKLINLAIAAGLAFFITMLFVLGANFTAPKITKEIKQERIQGTNNTIPKYYDVVEPESTIHRVFILFGGSMPSGLIQAFTYFLFIYGLLDIRMKKQDIAHEELMFNRELLPVEDHQKLSIAEVEQLNTKMIEIERRNPSVLGNLIRRASAAFLSNKSPSDTLNLVSTQVRISQADSESEHALVRYVAWAVPSVGFIGTVIGIAAALSIAYKADDGKTGIKEITDVLGIAFDTTLVALLLDIVFVYYVYDLQERGEKLFARMETYLIENFINRIG